MGTSCANVLGQGSGWIKLCHLLQAMHCITLIHLLTLGVSKNPLPPAHMRSHMSVYKPQPPPTAESAKPPQAPHQFRCETRESQPAKVPTGRG